MESPQGTMINPTSSSVEVAPQTVQGKIAEDLEVLIARVRQEVQGRTGQREWALARTKLEEAAHWVSEARDMQGGRGISPGWFPEREVSL